MFLVAIGDGDVVGFERMPWGHGLDMAETIGSTSQGASPSPTITTNDNGRDRSG